MHYLPTPTNKSCNCSDPCISTDDVYYAGPNLPNSGINTNNILTVVIEKLDAIYAIPTLQRVTEIGNLTTLPIIADSFVKIGGNGNNVLLDNGTTISLSSIGGSQNLQQVTDIGAITTNPITADSFIKEGGDGNNILLDDGTVLPIGDLPIEVTKTSELTNDGQDGTHPFISALDIPTYTSSLINDGADGEHPFITAEDIPTFNPSDYDLDEFTNNNIDPFAHISDIPVPLGYTPVNKAGDTMLGDLILNEDPSTALGAATKQYVDNVVSGINFHSPVYVATTGTLLANYNNGVAGVGATLTATSSGTIYVDGNYPTYLDRILVWQQSNAIQNGIYDVTVVGSPSTPYQLTRSADSDNSPPGEIHYGDYTLILSGDTNGGFGFICNTPGTIDIGTTPINYVQFNAAQAITAGYGLEELTPNVISIDPLITQEKITLTTDGTSGAATLISNTLNIPTLLQATTSVNGYLTSTDWNTFNNKENAISSGTSLQYWRGDKTFQTLNTSVVPENTNLYFTNSRAQSALAGMYEVPLTFSSPLSRSVNTISLQQSNTSTNGYLSSTDWNTFNGKANVNSQVFTGTPSLPTGTIGVTQTAGTNNTTLATTAFATTALNGKMNNPSLTASYIPKALTATTIGNSRLLDTGTYLGIDTINTPTKDITLGNQANREIGIEESTNIVVGRDLAINAGRTVNYVPSTGFIRLNLLLVEYYGADSLSNGDILITGNGSVVYKLVAGSPPFVNYGIAPVKGMISIHPTNDNIIYATGNGNNLPIYISTNGGVSFSAISGITSRNYIYVKIMPNNDAYATVSGSNDIYKRTGGAGDFIAMGFTARSYKYIISTPSGDAYFPVAGDDIYKINSGTSVLTALGQTFRSWNNGYFLNGDLYIGVAGGASYKQTGLAGNFVLNTLFTYPVAPVGNLMNVTVSKTTNNVYVPAYNSDVWVQYNNGEGTSNLSGGKLKLYSGTGKGSGDSSIEMWTGQVLSSGTTMQTATLRAKIDNTGLMTLPSVTNALIEADTTGKAVVTKEYANNRLVVETTSGYGLTNADSGGIVIFKTTVSQTLTIPTGLADGFECTFVTLSGVTLTVVSTGNTLNNATSTTMLPQLSFTLKRMLATNTYITAGSL